MVLGLLAKLFAGTSGPSSCTVILFIVLGASCARASEARSRAKHSFFMKRDSDTLDWSENGLFYRFE
jgi:hypothetical protein